MRDSKIKNLSASIRQKLLNFAQERNDDFGLLLTKYGLERMLFRLSKSKYRDTFILKGALLFELWTKERYRATRDADFLAKGDNFRERFVRIFQEISAMEVQDDGLRFDPKTVKAERTSKRTQITKAYESLHEQHFWTRPKSRSKSTSDSAMPSAPVPSRANTPRFSISQALACLLTLAKASCPRNSRRWSN